VGWFVTVERNRYAVVVPPSFPTCPSIEVSFTVGISDKLIA
jgi:hypothetical protein